MVNNVHWQANSQTESRFYLYGAVGIFLLSYSDLASAQAVEVFRGSVLRNTFAAGVLVSATKRSDGNEILKIRANSHTAQAFIRAKLPASTGERPYNFSLEIGEPAVSRQACSRFPQTRVEFEDCLATKAPQLWQSWDIFELEAVDAEIKQIGLRSAEKPTVYARCAYVPSHKMWLSCDYVFEQGGHRHVLSTSSSALSDISLFRCAALELRNAIWTDAPAFADICP